MNDDLPQAARDVLGTVAEYREAARRIIRAGQPPRDRDLALIDLMKSARREEDLDIRDWAQRAIWSEAQPVLDPAPRPPADWRAAQRRLRARGHASCPTCRAPLASDQALDRETDIRLGVVLA